MTNWLSQNPFNDVKEEITDSAARAFFVDTWANEMEERGKEPWAPGENIMDAAPHTPRSAERFAKKFVKAVEKANGGASISSLYQKAAATFPEEHRKEPTPEDFGHYLAMQAMGHGVSWTDDHPETGIKIPNAHYYYGGHGEIDERFMSEV